MKKRRIRIKPRFWCLITALVLGIVVLLGSCQSRDEGAKIDGCDVSAAEATQENDFILKIPLDCELQEELHEASEEFGVDYYIMVALIDRETKFRNVIGDGGESYGYCQIQPKWWYGLMMEIGATDLNVPKDNFRTACAIIAKLTEEHQSIEGALVAYNQGCYKGHSTEYSRDIIANADRYRA